MIFLSNYNKLLQNKFVIYYNDNSIVVTNDIQSHYLSDDKVLYELKDISVTKKEVLNILHSQNNLPNNLKKFINKRTRGLIGETLELITDKNKKTRFCENKKFAKYYGINKPINVTLEIIETFNNKKDFNLSFDSDSKDNIAFGLWEVESDEISTSFLFNHPLQTKMCFGDFGTDELEKGSLFIKMKIISTI